MAEAGHGVDGACEGELHGAAHLSLFFFRRDDGAEGADIEVFVTQCFLCRLFPTLLGSFLYGFCLVDLYHTVVEHGSFLDKDAVAGFAGFRHVHIVTDFALQAYVGHQTVAGFGVYAGKIAGIGVAVRIAVLNIEEIEEVDSFF